MPGRNVHSTSSLELVRLPFASSANVRAKTYEAKTLEMSYEQYGCIIKLDRRCNRSLEPDPLAPLDVPEALVASGKADSAPCG